MENTDQYMKSLTGYAFPTVIVKEGDADRSIRRWICRVRRVLPSVTGLQAFAVELQTKIGMIVIDAYKDFAPMNQIERNLPMLSLIRCDDHHVVAEIDLPSQSIKIDETLVIGTIGFLREIDSAWDIEDLEGIPRRYWFMLTMEDPEAQREAQE